MSVCTAPCSLQEACVVELIDGATVIRWCIIPCRVDAYVQFSTASNKGDAGNNSTALFGQAIASVVASKNNGFSGVGCRGNIRR